MPKNSNNSNKANNTIESCVENELPVCAEITALSRMDSRLYALIRLSVFNTEQYCVYVSDGDEAIECLGSSRLTASQIFELLVGSEVSAEQLFYVLCDIKSDFDGSFFN